MKKTTLILSMLLISSFTQAAQFEGSIPEWKENKERFKKPEESFRLTLQTLKEKYADQGVTEEQLYRAATEGMLAALNKGKENWNTLLTPREMQDMKIERTGKLVGIGATLEFDQASKNAKIRGVISGTGAEKAGLRKADQILSVDGKRFKDLPAMVESIRGNEGSTVNLKVLREDAILDVKVTRSVVTIPLDVAAMVDPQTAYLQISGFADHSVANIKEQLKIFEGHKLGKLILDLRGNRGGLFDSFLGVADLFLKKDEVIAKARGRDGGLKEYKAHSEPWHPETKIVVLVDGETSCSGEVLAQTLRENRKATLLGSKTAGKWSVESVEGLPNDYSIKYSIMALYSPAEKTFDGVGLTPDFEITKATDGDFLGSDFTRDLKARLEKDPAMKAAAQILVR